MAVRNLQRLEKLSSATGLGLWAEGVLTALDRVTRLGQRDQRDLETLNGAAKVLDAARDRSEKPAQTSPTAKALAATDTALDVAETLGTDHSPEKTREILGDVGAILRKAAGEAGTEETLEIGPAVEFFSTIGRQQLAEGYRVVGASGGSKPWAAASMTSSSS
jgi:hypothetical protein